MAAPVGGRRSDLYIRTSWVDASIALAQLDKGRIKGGRTALWTRAKLQERLATLGAVLHVHAGKVLFVAILLLATFCVGLKSAQIHKTVEQLWIQEGGRLEAELEYTKTALSGSSGGLGSTHQLVIQVSPDSEAFPLVPKALLMHLEAIKKAASTTVTVHGMEWDLNRFCQKHDISNILDVRTHVYRIFQRFIPCPIATPLDCFWEGSILLGPDHPITLPVINVSVDWTKLSPKRIIESVKKQNISFPFPALETTLERIGLTTAYQTKPCLDPTNPSCPDTAPNKKSQLPPDVGAELAKGCYGLASKFMHWPKELIVGGGEYNETGHLKRAKGLQSVVHLMAESDFYEMLREDYANHGIMWTQEKAANILQEWQRKFSEEIRKYSLNASEYNHQYDFLAFSSVSLDDILEKFTHLSIPKIAIGYACILLYVAVSLGQWNDSVKSQIGVGIAGVLLLVFTVVAGLGFCALLGIPFNVSTLQILPFLAIGLGVDDMFLLTHAYAKTSYDERDCDGYEGKTPAVLRSTGLSVLQTSLGNVLTFFAAALIPIPALRVFSLQAAILLLFNLASMLLVYPAMISLDIRRRMSQRSDLLCCIVPEKNYQPTTVKLSYDAKKSQPNTKVLPTDKSNHNIDKKKCPEAAARLLDSNNNTNSFGINFSLTIFVREYYGPFVMKPFVKVVCMLFMIGLLIASLWSVTKLTDGLDLTDIAPQNTDEHKFLTYQEKYFGFYNMYAITKGNFEYPTNQKLLHEFHDAFIRIPNIIKNDNGGLPGFWLSLFRDWLLHLQRAFDEDYANGCITQETWYNNASADGKLAYKLLVQTGHSDDSVDKSLIGKVRLVDGEGIIRPKPFYNYLTAWVTKDPFTYGASGANLKPMPKEWTQWLDEYMLVVPKSLPLTYAQIPLYLHSMNNTENIKSLITSVRELCAKFEAKGLSSYPSGILFIFWEQYMHLRILLALALLCALGAVLIITSILLLNLWAALLVVFMLASIVLQLLGVMSFLAIKLSAIPAVLVIMAVGIGVHFTVHICLSFVTSIGNKDRRAQLALEHMFAPIVHGAITTLIAVIMLATSDFSFIIRYFFCILLALVAIGLVNGLLFFPILLSLIGPSAEVIPLEHPDRISTPSPVASPVHARRATPPAPHYRLRPPSLTTISEEPPSCHSSHSHHSSMQSIVVQPEVVIETTTYNTDGTSGSGRSTPTVSQMGGITTKVTTTANIKVEVHTPMMGHDRCHTRRYYRDRDVYYDRDRNRDRDRGHHRDRDSYRDNYRDYHDRERSRDRDGYRDRRDKHRSNYREGRDSGHESDTSRH